jgi:hypothetical protein
MAELFDKFEINRAPRWPLMTRLVALSVVLHGLFIVSLAYVPQLSAMMHVAGQFAGIKFVSEDYDPTLVGQRATVIQLAPHEKLYYPPDYFGAPEVAETAPPEPVVVQQAAPPPPVYRPRIFRAPRPVAQPSPSPSPEEVAKATPTPAPSPSPEDEKKKAEEEAELDKIAEENGIKRPPKINEAPFVDIGLEGKKLFDEGKLDLHSAVEVMATAQINPDGTLDDVQTKWVTVSDENTEMLARKLLTAISQSKVLGLLEGAKEVNMALKLDQQNVSVRVTTDMASAQDATKYATGLGLILWKVRSYKAGTDEGELYNSLKFSNEGNQFTMSFEMKKEDAGRIITAMLTKKAAKDAAAAQNKS